MSVLIPILKVMARFNDVTSDVPEWAVPVTPSNSLFTLILSFTSSTLRTKNLSVVIPKTSFATIPFLD